MKNKFAWYFPLNDEEIKEIWDQAILTVDANVLLDLYRYHEDTRNALLKAVEKFKGRVWLSHQTAEEFFRNRKRVIVSSVNSYNDATKQLSSIQEGAEEPLNRLQNNRIIPDEIVESLRAVLDKGLGAARTIILEAREKHPNFLQTDTILDTLSSLFDGSVGDDFSAGELEEAKKEGKRRLDSKIPPGFLDSNKDGDRPYGDYFMWRQILEHAKIEKKPMIFVTSEGKEDWWEKASGQTTGLNYELLKEAHEITGQRLLAYQTDRFFRFSEKLSGEKSNESAAKEISALVEARSASAPLLRLLSQTEVSTTQTENNGTLTVELHRPSYNFTCSGHLEPNFIDVPKINARLIRHPEKIPPHTVRAGTGTTFDFNIHIKSTEYEVGLPVGEYVFEYGASVPNAGKIDE